MKWRTHILVGTTKEIWMRTHKLLTVVALLAIPALAAAQAKIPQTAAEHLAMA
jgi:hypothetical protein